MKKELSPITTARWNNKEIDDIAFLDHIFEATKVEIKPRVYRGDWKELIWCVEIYDWENNKELKTLVNFPSREKAVREALLWYYFEYYLENA
jgi:hypothetical protein